MSIDDLPYTADEAYQGGFERTPPQDIPAEQSVLGGMLLSKDAIAEVIEVIKAIDFYKPAHELVFASILELYGRGEPADPVTVAALLTKKGDINRVGGAPYLHTLINSVPTAANAGYYAEIVKERAVLRRLVEAGTRIVQMGYSTDGSDVEQIVDAAQQEMYNVTEARTSEDYIPLADAMEGALDEIESISNRSGQMTGVPTGFHDLDALTNGLHPGQMVIIAARPAIGKALALDTPLPTPSGWTTMGEVHVGDLLLGADGRPTRVIAATEVMTDRPCYEVEFSDGSVIAADGQHQWFTETRASQRAAQGALVGAGGPPPPRATGSVKTTEEIAGTLRCETADRRLNHSVPVASAVELPEADLPLSPYALGVLLGGGHSDAGHSDAAHGLDGLDGLDGKHIPAAYLRASVRQRRALLAGLLDSNGSVDRTGTVRFSVTNRRLALDTHELILSLGYQAVLSGTTTTAHTVTFTPADPVFRLTRKLVRQTTRDHPTTRQRYITAVRRIDSVPVRCVEVDNDDHLYLAGHSWIPTHNSTLGLDLARSCSIKNGLTSVIFSLEMGRNEIIMRLLSAEARVALHHMRSGTMTDEDWARLARRMGPVSEAPLFIDDSPNMSMMEIRAKARRLKQRHGLQLVIIDYMQLMQHSAANSKRPDNRQQEVSEISRSLKLLAKELEVPVIAISQLNRGPEQRTDKRPMMSDLRESGSLEQDADVIILLHREDAYERESPRAGEADLIVAKHRNGPTANITVAFQGHYSRFVDMAQS
ncbi:replicative DNA helicase [Catenulispora pinisilvae]|uniref:replicative DNA helicase n=1 Tax=Catenulispora pinisilvae TaxID=2705253 RepID=UPI001892454E|nr:replicative DNA helicase [Catenulispora pinisilvae]